MGKAGSGSRARAARAESVSREAAASATVEHRHHPALAVSARVAPVKAASRVAPSREWEAAVTLRASATAATRAVTASIDRLVEEELGAVADKQSREKFLSAYDGANKLVASGNSTVLQVGNDDWPFPIPLVKDGERWRFDPEQGREEILARRIGRNELYTIETCLAYVDAQRDDLPRQSRWRGLPEGSRTEDARPRPSYEEVQPGWHLDEGGHPRDRRPLR